MDMKNSVKRIFIMMLACMLFFSAVSVNNSINAEAAAKVTKIKLSKKSLTVNVGSSKKLTVTLSPAKAKKSKVTWTSSNKKVATVKNGKVTGVSVGTATITAKAGGKKASCKVKVTLSKKAKEAIKAYKKYLGNKIIKRDTGFVDSKDVKFLLADVNVDGVPELFIDVGSSGGLQTDWQKIYCYYGGKVTEIGGGHSDITYYPISGIVSIYSIQDAPIREIISYYKISKKGKGSMIATSDDALSEEYEDYYWWKEKYVTKSKFYSNLNKAVGKKKIKIRDSDWHQNNKENRKNMEKLIKK